MEVDRLGERRKRAAPQRIKVECTTIERYIDA